MTAPAPDPRTTARLAAADAALALIAPGMAIGLGSGRAVWAVIDGLKRRHEGAAPFRVVAASNRTAELARDAGMEIVALDGRHRIDLAIDGADEFDADLDLLKGGGGALLREKIVVRAARRFVVLAEEHKRVERLGRDFRLPVEIVPFGWGDTRREVLEVVEDAMLRADGELPYRTDEHHLILDCRAPAEGDLHEVGAALKSITGVVEHGFFLDMADTLLLGHGDGSVTELTRSG